MNYFEFHLGDYAEATAHLSFVEDAAYLRLLRKVYSTEKPLPADKKACQRLVGARTKEEREAVDSVLDEFFTLADDGWHNDRADAEIDRFQDKQAKAKRSAEARWGSQPSQSERNANAMRTHDERISDRNANALPTQSEGNAPRARPQTPDTRHQSSDSKNPTVNAPRGASDPKPLGVDDLVAEGVERQSATDWLKARKAKRAPLTQTAWDAVKREAFKAGISPAHAVKTCAEKSWQGFDAEWFAKLGPPKAPDVFSGAV